MNGDGAVMSTVRVPKGIAALSRPSLGRWMAEAIFDWAWIAIIFVAVARFDHPIAYVLGVIALATRQHAISFLGHDGAHYRISRHRRLNDTLTGIFAFWPVAIPLDGYRRFHFRHHETLGTDADPELEQREFARPQWDLPTTRWRVRLYLLRDLTGMAISDLYCFARVMPAVSLRDRLGPLLWWGTALTIMAFTGTLWMAAMWWISVFTAYWAVFRLRMWCEHIGTTSTHRVSVSWWQRALYQPHNAWCHYEHHRWPSVPCWNLPAARALDDKTEVLSVKTLWDRLEDAPSMPLGIVPKPVLS